MSLKQYIIRLLLVFLPDKWFLAIRFYLSYKRFPDLKNGKTFDEKILHYILNYKNDILPVIVDKYKVRSYVKDAGYGHILNELYGVYDKFEDIDFDVLPDQFVLKTNHGCAFNIIVKDKTTFDVKAARKKVNRWMRMNFFYYTREWPYKNIERKIICEKYLENTEYSDLVDYKISCFYGEISGIYAMYNRHTEESYKVEVYDTDWNLKILITDENADDPNAKLLGNKGLVKPVNLDEMLQAARGLSKEFPFLRVDLYSVGDKVYLGELTLYPSGGLAFRHDSDYNNLSGSLMPDY